MSRHDMYPEDVEGLLASHESREQAKRLIERHQLRASSEGEGLGGMRAIGGLLLVVLCLVLFNVPPLAAWLIRVVPAWYDAAAPFVQRLVAALS